MPGKKKNLKENQCTEAWNKQNAKVNIIEVQNIGEMEGNDI
jgi:hypothetical protein